MFSKNFFWQCSYFDSCFPAIIVDSIRIITKFNNIMGNLLVRAMNALTGGNKERRIIMLGLDAAGKLGLKKFA